MSVANTRRVITKMLVSGAVALGAWVVAAAPASADSNPASANPNPFATLSCACHENAPAGSPLRKDEIARGIAEGRAAPLPGIPAPTQPGPTVATFPGR
jgi:hypothetical protein